ncbi:MAG: fasciclin domain-containing protein [Bacteroidota bacterium]
MKSLFSTLLLAGAFLAVAPAIHAQDTALADLIANHPDAGTMAAAVKTAGIDAELREGNGLILLVPTDEAFSALPTGVVNALLQPENEATLRQILEYHLLGGDVETAKSVLGERLETASATPGAELPATNGTAYLIDRVLLPPGLDLSTLIDER